MSETRFVDRYCIHADTILCRVIERIISINSFYTLLDIIYLYSMADTRYHRIHEFRFDLGFSRRSLSFPGFGGADEAWGLGICIRKKVVCVYFFFFTLWTNNDFTQ